MQTKGWTRRGFLGVVVSLPAAVIAACGSSESGVNGAAAGASGTTTTGGTGAGGLGAGGAGAGGLGAGGMATSGSGTGGAGTGGEGTGGAPETTSAGGSGGSGTGGSGAGGSGSGGAPPEQHVCSPNYPRIDLKADCGAVGDGQTNDTKALQKAASIIQQAGGGELTIPPGVYIVGDQIKKQDPNAPGPYYVPIDMFKVHDLACLKISGYGATLRVKSGLHYGGFDPKTGQPVDVTGGASNAAHIGHVIEVVSSDAVLIEGIELDGNNENLVLGGQWGDVDRQTHATGLWFNMCQNVDVVDVHTHHHGLDGVTVCYTNGPPPKKMPHKLERVVSEYNGRQGISWVGGWGLECVDCKFNHTGRAVNGGQPLMSKPRAGLDIEPNGGTTQKSREGVFTNCEFIDNAGPGVLASNGDGGYSTFDGCTIWGTTSYSIWVVKPGVKFTNCSVHGTAVHGSDGHTAADPAPNPALALRFEGCTFEDKPWQNGKVYRNASLYTVDEGAEGMTWKHCTFINHAVRSVWIGDATAQEIFDGCTFVHSNTTAASGASQAHIVGSKIRSCHFKESSAVSSGASKYYIDVSSVTVLAPAPGDPATHVDGPKVKWNSTSGLTGDIAPGTYA